MVRAAEPQGGERAPGTCDDETGMVHGSKGAEEDSESPSAPTCN
jgi:hypothetical protein